MSTFQDHNQQVCTQHNFQCIVGLFDSRRQWSYNDPYRYPIPRGNEDPLETLLELLLAKDKVQCDAWKDEVQNLLIFVCARSIRTDRIIDDGFR
jgi:hypothetical protein